MAYNWGNATAGFGLFGLPGMGLGFMGNDQPKKLSSLDPNQQKLWNTFTDRLQNFSGADQSSIDYLMQLMDPNSEAVSQFTAPHMRQFNEQTVPGLAERFAGMGGMGGGLSSSGFGQSLSAAGSGLQEKLAALKAGLGTQAANNLMNTYGNRMGTAMGTQTFGYQKPQQSMLETLGPAILQNLPQILAMMA